jgi:hypothetical protein
MKLKLYFSALDNECLQFSNTKQNLIDFRIKSKVGQSTGPQRGGYNHGAASQLNPQFAQYPIDENLVSFVNYPI